MFGDVDLEALATAVAAHPEAHLADPWGAVELDRVVAYERLIRWAEGRKAAQVEALVSRQRGGGVSDDVVFRSVGSQLSMALGIGVTSAMRLVGFAGLLGRHPQLQTGLAAGEISMPVARAVAETCTVLPAADARAVDDQLAGRLAGATVHRAGALAREAVAAQDPIRDLRRTVRARRDRFVSVYPEADGVGRLEARLPLEQAAACFETLHSHGLAVNADGDPRTVSQTMADTLVERLTGARTASEVPVEVGLVMYPDDLLGHGNNPALLAGYGPLAAPLARQLATGSQTWLRRLFTDPAGHLTGLDTRRRRFDGPLARLIRLRDTRCAAPACDAKTRDLDHIHPHRSGGPTSLDNGQGLCQWHNHGKETPGWTVHPTRSGTVWTTPTGHRHHKNRQPLHGHIPRRPPPDSVLERILTRTLIAHTLHPPDPDPG